MKLSEKLYNLLIHAGLPALVAGTYAAFRNRNPDYQTGRKFSLPSTDFFKDECRLWIHGASVGEAGVVNTVKRLAVDLGVDPEAIFVSTQTESGLGAVDHDRKFLLPADYPALIGPLSSMIDADCLAVVETEIWPNLYRWNSDRTVLLNARISDSTVDSYRWLKPLLEATLDHTRGIFARSREDYDRFLELGAHRQKLEMTGDLKWTRALDPPRPDLEIPWDTDTGTILTAGSTHPGEEEIILDVFEPTDYRLVLAPRHLGRLEDVESLLNDRPVTWRRWSELPVESGSPPEVILVDEFGLLEGLYSESDLVLIGGSWTARGGHNLLEAAQYGVPVVTGPHLDNFREMVVLLEDLGMLEVVDRDELDPVLETPPSPPDDAVKKLHDNIRPIEQRYRRVLARALSVESGEAVNHNE